MKGKQPRHGWSLKEDVYNITKVKQSGSDKL